MAGAAGSRARRSTGGVPRRETDRVTFADFAPNQSLAVTRAVSQKGANVTLEWPQGKPLLKAEDNAALLTTLPNPRVSPSGSHIAFFACQSASCSVRIADQSGKTVAESQAYVDWWGLAWTPGGHEVWFSVAESGGRQCTLRALDLSGHERVIFRTPGAMTVHDISAEGRLLAAFDQISGRLEFRDSLSAPLLDLSWKEGGRGCRRVAQRCRVVCRALGTAPDLTARCTFVVPADPEPLRISGGEAVSISDDGTKALVVVRSPGKPITLTIVPTAGLAQPIDVGPFEAIIRWMASGWPARARAPAAW